MRVATYNVHHCRGMDGEVDVERIGRTLVDLEADFIALQELDRAVERSGLVDQPSRLEELTGMRVHFFPTAKVGKGDFGIAVATRHDVAVEFRPLPKTPFDRRHAVATATFEGLSILATHLSRKPTARAVELPNVWLKCLSLESPKVVLGDFNMSRLGLSAMALTGLREEGGNVPTFPASEPRRQPDHILASGELEVVQYQTVGSTASDHLPLVIELTRRSKRSR